MRAQQGQAAPRVARAASFVRALLLIGLIGTLGGLLELVLVLPGSEFPGVLVLYTVVFWVYLAAGLVAWYRRPSNPMAALILAGALVVYLSNLRNASPPILVGIGLVFTTTILAVIVHLLLAFPSGRLGSNAARVVVAGAYFVAVVLQAPLYLATSETVLETAIITQRLCGFTVMGATSLMLALRVRAADPAHRRVLLPLFSYGMFVVLGVPFATLLFDGFAPPTREVVQLVLLTGVPIAFVFGMLRGGFTHVGELADLGVWLSVDVAADSLQDALALTLGDDTVRLGLRGGAPGEFVDEAGETVNVVGRAQGREVVEVTVAGESVAVIEYDSRMNGNAEHVRRAGQVLAVALDRTRLSAELLRSQRELRESRTRIVEAADLERLRIAQDLHDGLQVQLVLLALEAQQIAGIADSSPSTKSAATTLRKRIDAAAADLRRLVHDVLPLTLTERGLSDAVEDLVDRMPIPTALEVHPPDLHLSEPVSNTAYFVVAEALANTVKHADAASARVSLVQTAGALHIHVSDSGRGGVIVEGRGLRGLADRVDALGGTVNLRSPDGGGMALTVELPCEL
ncbi:histidine kinase [Microbacterium sp. NPDC076911]|uniref:sensor histidine kinase n=1 Tax=Microbacterium sp. NPDC076911 TaxID=3154958 RepID=UPI003446096E